VLIAKVQEALEHQLTHRVQQGIARMLLLRTAGQDSSMARAATI